MKILNEKKIEHKSILAQFDLEFENWGLTIRKCKLMRNSKNAYFVSYPSERYEDKNDGNKVKYFPFIIFSKDKKDENRKKNNRTLPEKHQ